MQKYNPSSIQPPANNSSYYAVIMAGGIGSRFWPVSTPGSPKQFHDMTGTGKSLLRHTFDRLTALIPASHILISTNEKYAGKIAGELPGFSPEHLIAEPVMRNTAPAILYAMLKIQKLDPEATVVIAPSDHWIEDEAAFVRQLETAFRESAHHDILMTLGIVPDSPNTGYGYIHYGNGENRVKKVLEFTEKPDKKTAIRFIEQGEYLWNAGIFIWNVRSILKAFQTHLPAMYRLFASAPEVWNTPAEKAFIEKYYPQAENISIDYGIMEKATNVRVLPLEHTGWNDLGTWGALRKQLPKDDNGNAVLHAHTRLIDSENNIIRTTEGKKVVIKGMRNYIIVETDDVLMIIPESDEQAIKEYAKSFDKQGLLKNPQTRKRE